MGKRFALSVYKEYYRALFCYFHDMRNYKENYGEFIKSFFTELENSEIPDWARHHFVDTTIDYPIDFESDYFVNQHMVKNQDDKKRSEKWEKEQTYGLMKYYEIANLANKRCRNKYNGVVYEDEKKYEGIVEIIEKHGGLDYLFAGHLTNEEEKNTIYLYTNYATQGRMFNEQNEQTKENKVKTLKMINKN